MNNKAGFTLVELLIVAGILAVVIVGMMQLFIFSSYQASVAGNMTIAVSEAQNKLEEIRNNNYDDIAGDYGSGGTPGNTFTLDTLTGMGSVYVDDTDSELLIIKAVVCWQDKFNRIIGEDLNLNGLLDDGEDLNGNNELDSPATLISMITRR